MTPTEIDNLPAGAELDRLVAEAIKRPTRVQYGRCLIAYNYRTANGVTGAERGFEPSADWNDAMEAAEKCQLFRGGYLTEENSTWIVGRTSWTAPYMKRSTSAPTGPLAIARAIAKIGETK